MRLRPQALNVVVGFPPNYREIVAAVGHPPITAVYAYGGTIYSPSGRPIPYDLEVHERTHFDQQERVGGPEAWWERYLADPDFRLEQEVEAYQQQIGTHSTHAEKLRCWRACSEALAGPMYGWLVTPEQARALLADSVR